MKEKRDLHKDFRSLKAQEKNIKVKIRGLLSSLNEAYAKSVAIGIEKEFLSIEILCDKAEKNCTYKEAK